MSIKQTLLKFIEASPLLRSSAIRMQNKMEVNGNDCDIANIHCRKNTLRLLGKQESIQLDRSSMLRDSTVHMEGSENRFSVGGSTSIYGEKSRVVYVSGNSNRIVIGANCMLTKVSFFIRGSGNTIIIGDNCSVYDAQFHIEQDGNEIRIGSGTTMHGRGNQPIHMAADEGSKILIGEDCMLAHSTQIRSTDSHSIVDLQGIRLNPARDIIIGSHCWIGLQCIILKGTEVAHNCVIAAGTVCSKKYPEPNCILAGNPAKIVKRDIDWDRKFV